MHALLHTDVGKDWFDNAEPSGVDLLSLIGIDLGLHLIDQVRRLRMHWDGKIPARGGWFAQTAHLQRTGGAVCDTGMVDIIGSMAVDLTAGMAGWFFPMWTTIDLSGLVEREVCRGELLRLGACLLFDEAFLIREARIAFAELDIGDVGTGLGSRWRKQ